MSGQANERPAQITVVSVRGGEVKVNTETRVVKAWPVWEVASDAARQLGYPMGDFTLASEDGVVIDPLADCPRRGRYELVPMREEQ